MSHLIIGHVTASTARVWVRGEKKSKEARLRFRELIPSPGPWTTVNVPLVEHRGFVEVIQLENLKAGATYDCGLSYKEGPAPPVNAARFTTAGSATAPTTFLLGSCNWSRGGLIKIGNAKKSWEGIKAIIDATRPDFMIHCGDQVYSDVLTGPLPKDMHLPFFRGLYQTAWKVQPTAEVLAALPHYMVLDDHEIFNDYFNGKLYAGQESQAIANFAKQAYTEYQHSRNPQGNSEGFYFSFDRGGARFFALDVRTERHKGDHATMVGTEQLVAFKQWLRDNKDHVKFVVTSVPFLAEVRSGDDKWCSRSFRFQRDEILDHVASNRIGRLVFLTGDMHCSCHTTLTLQHTTGPLVIHELMSSPINQVAPRSSHEFVLTLDDKTQAGQVPYTIALPTSEFYGEHSNVMVIDFVPPDLVKWAVYRTKDPGVPPGSVLSGQFRL